jgi:hypothetical protein
MSSEIYQMNSATNQLSDYQRGVLNELGILCWKKQIISDDGALIDATVPLAQSSLVKPQADVTNKDVALNRLQQLKTEQVSVSYTGKVLCSFTSSAELTGLMRDIIGALEFADKPVVSLTKAELAQAKDYAFIWQNGDELELSNKQLITPELSKLKDPLLKKQLWQLIQNRTA